MIFFTFSFVAATFLSEFLAREVFCLIATCRNCQISCYAVVHYVFGILIMMLCLGLVMLGIGLVM